MGMFTIIVDIAILMRGTAMIEIMLGDHSIVLVLAMISVAAGLAIILTHNIWFGGALPVVVTMVGWLTLAKGVLLLFFSPEILAHLFEWTHNGGSIYFYLAPTFLLGVYLTWASVSACGPQIPAPKSLMR
jgi:hypothetical protein